MKKAVLSGKILCLAIVLVLGLAILAFAASDAAGFSDVDENAWYAEAVVYVRDHGLMSGTSGATFFPDQEMTRAMLATVLYRAASSPEVSGSSPFSDAANNTWYTDAVLWASQSDLMDGYGNGLFGVNDPVTREQMITIIWRSAGRPPDGSESVFADARQISSYARDAVSWSSANGIISGVGGNRFDPKGVVTRAQAATILMNYYKNTSQELTEMEIEIIVGGKSFTATLVDRYPRDSFTLATKLHVAFFNSPEEREKVFNEQLEQTGAGYFDYYLLHGIEAAMLLKYEEFDCFGWLLDKKAKGLVKHAGFSFHDSAELLDEILTKHPEMEFVQLQINYLDWESEWVQSRAYYEVAVKHGKPVIVMEPVKGGTLANVPAQAEKLLKGSDPTMSVPSWAIRFAASLDHVMVVLSGMSNIEQMEDNLSYMEDFQPLTDEEKATCYQVADIINGQIAVPCTGCSYCTEGCPMKIAIPQYFSLYNEDMRENLEEKGWTVNFTNYEILTNKFGKAKDCVECGQCEGVCPQHLPIIKNLKAVSKHFDH